MLDGVSAHVAQDYAYLHIGLELLIHTCLDQIYGLLCGKPERDVVASALSECSEKEQGELWMSKEYGSFIPCYDRFLLRICLEPLRHDPCDKYVHGILERCGDIRDIDDDKVR